MARTSLSLRLKSVLARHPVLANRVMGLLGSRRIEGIAKRTAIRAARQAYAQVPFYHQLFETHGFDSKRMQRLTWEDFLQLPTSDKVQTTAVPDRDLVDANQPSPETDALIGRSSGTSGQAVFWPLGWDEFSILRAVFWRWLRDLGADHSRTAFLVSMGVDGTDLAGNAVLAATFSVKEQTHWPVQTFAAGEDPNDIIALARWLTGQQYETFFISTFPGTVERLLNRIAELERADPGSGVNWSAFKRIQVALSGQLISAALRQRVQREMGVRPFDMLSLYASSDAGGITAQSTPFTLWLEGLLETYPALYDALGIALEHRTKTIMECVPSLSVYIERDEDDTLLFTTWKHRPLIRYRTNDLAILLPVHDIVRTLNREVAGWRRDFARAGYGRGYIPKAVTVAMILGRADDIRIVNAANISPEILRDALEASGIMPNLHHFKHDTDETRPNAYLVYLELNDTLDNVGRTALAEEWKPQLLSALITQPASTDLAAAHRANPIDLEVFVRSRDTEEFEGDDQRRKKTYIPRRRRASVIA
jgi:phenylacetate-coenzyme A ligase PaaK-like adenylate-forming protein